MTAPITPDEDRPDRPNADVEGQQKALILCRDVASGTLHLRDTGRAYLPQAPGEINADYDIRLARSVLFNAFTRTIKGLAGMVFRRDPVLEDDVPPKIAGDYENIDLAGTHGDVFLRQLLEDSLEVGHSLILVDYPDLGGRVLPRDIERSVGLRPYWVHVKKDNIVSWRTENVAGQTVLAQLVLREVSTEAKGKFGEAKVERYRAFTRQDGAVRFEVYRKVDDKIIPERTGVVANQERIPVAEVATSGRRRLFVSNPPLEDLATINVAHYQVLSDQLNALHKANSPVMVIIGREMLSQEAQGEKVVVGPSWGLSLPLGADAKYIEPTGAALGASRTQLQDFETQMARLGLSMLQQESRAAETAEAKRIDKSEGDSALSVAARGLQDAVELAFEFHARYRGLPEGGSVTINRDFEELELTPDEVRMYSELVSSGQLSLDTMYAMLARGERLPEDFNPEEEKDKIAADDMGKPQAVPALGPGAQASAVAASDSTMMPIEK